MNGKNLGHNIFETYLGIDNKTSVNYHPYDNYTTQGIKTHVQTAGVRVAYLMDRSMNLELELGWMMRSETSSIYTLNTSLVFIPLRMRLKPLSE